MPYIALTLLLATLAVSLHGMVGLNGDGVSYLYKVLVHRDFFAWIPVRVHAQYISQAPVLLALWLGVRQMDILVHLFTFGTIGIPILIWIIALFIQRNQLFWPFFLVASFSILNVALFAVGEANVCYALVGLSAALLLRPAIGPISGIVLALSAVATVRAYQSMVFLGPLLALLAARGFFRETATSVKVCYAVAAVAYAAAAIVAALNLYLVRDVAGIEAATSWRILATFPQLIAFGIATAALILTFSISNRLVAGALLAVAVGCVLIMGQWRFWPDTSDYYYWVRGFVGMAIAVGLALALVFDLQMRPVFNRTSSAAVALVLAAVMLASYTNDVLSHTRWITAFSNTLNQNIGKKVVSISDTPLRQFPDREYPLRYTNLVTLSFVLGGPCIDAIVGPPPEPAWEMPPLPADYCQPRPSDH